MRLLLIGLTFIILGILLVMISPLVEMGGKTERKIEYGGVVMLGPIPLVFGNSRDSVVYALVLALFVLGLVLFLSQIQR